MVSKNFWIHHCIIIYIWSLRIDTFCDIPYLPAATKLWPREYFYTCLSFYSQGGACLSACWDTTTTTPGTRPPHGPDPPGADTPLGPDTPQPDPPEQTPHTPGSRHPPQGRHHTPLGSRLQHTVYERPVRILLECILVCNKIIFYQI